MDYSAAFDLVDRDLLLFALLNAGVDRHMIKVIREMYKNTSGAVRVNNSITQWFMTRAGVRQGQKDSPTAFAVFINSLAVELKQLNIGITIGHSKVSILLFADDIISIAEKENELQTLLDKLHAWCRKNGIRKFIRIRPRLFTLGLQERLQQNRCLL